MSLRSADELQSWLNASRDADVERILRNEGISYVIGVDQRPCTTDEAINDVLVGSASAKEEFEFGSKKKTG